MKIRRVVVDGLCNGYDCDNQIARSHSADVAKYFSQWSDLQERAERGYSGVDTHERHGGEWILEITL